MIKFIFKNKTAKELKIAADLIPLKVEKVLKSDELKRQLREMTFDPRFTKPANINGLDLIYAILSHHHEIKIGTYTQKFLAYKIFPVNAFKPDGSFDEIFFNTRNLFKRKIVGPDSSEETLWHELVHVLDSLMVERFDHGENSLKGKENTAPVKFAAFMASINLEGVQYV